MLYLGCIWVGVKVVEIGSGIILGSGLGTFISFFVCVCFGGQFFGGL